MERMPLLLLEDEDAFSVPLFWAPPPPDFCAAAEAEEKLAFDFGVGFADPVPFFETGSPLLAFAEDTEDAFFASCAGFVPDLLFFCCRRRASILPSPPSC